MTTIPLNDTVGGIVRDRDSNSTIFGQRLKNVAQSGRRENLTLYFIEKFERTVMATHNNPSGAAWRKLGGDRRNPLHPLTRNVSTTLK
jgi:hypothetical protein